MVSQNAEIAFRPESPEIPSKYIRKTWQAVHMDEISLSAIGYAHAGHN